MSPSSSLGCDRDEAFDEDMEALKRACMMTGNTPSGNENSDSDSDSDSGSESSGSDDVDLLRRLQERFSMPSAAVDSLPFVKPVSSRPPPDSDDEDDLETLRAIRRRFNQYESGAMKEKSEIFLQESEMIAADVTSGQETPDILSKNRKCTEEHSDPGFTELHQAVDGSCNLSAKALAYSQFPKSAQNFVDALKKNRSCQRFIRRKLIEIEAKIEENKELKEHIKCLMDFQVICIKKVGRTLCQKKDPRVRLISMQKPRISKAMKTTWRKVPALYYGPAENSHVSKFKMVMKRFPVSFTKQPWSNIEKEKLAKGLKQQYQEMLLLNSMNLESDSEGSINPEIMSALLSGDLEVTPEKIRSFLPLVSWDRLASMYLTGRSGAECESRWLNCEDPLINHSPWTILEDKKLLFIVQERGIYNWIDITIALGTQRTPFQCLARYQRSLNPHILNKDWTKDEDAKLCAAVENFGDNNWQAVASNLEGRTGPQCSNRWRKSLHPDRKKVGRWSVDEDKRLKVAVMLFGAKNWNKIAQFAPGRTQVQCRERWLNCLDPSLNLEAWTEEEDAKLLEAIAEHGYSWSRVATCVPPRTDNQCRRRWKILLPHEVPLLRAARQMKRTVLISNFVDRESERPSIGPNDFSLLVNSPASECGNTRGISKKRLREGTRPENQREASSDKLPKKSRAKSRRPTEENLMEVGFVNSAEIASADLRLVPVVNTNTAESGSSKRTRKKASSEGSEPKIQRKASCGNQPKKSRAKSRSSFVGNLTAEGMVNTSAESIHVELSRIPSVNSNTAESGRIKGTRKKTSSENQPKKSRTKSRRYLEENFTAVDMVNSSAEIAPADLSMVPAVNSCAPESGSIRRTRKKMSSDNQPKESTLHENLTTDGIIKSAEIAPVDISHGVNSNNAESGRIKRTRKKTSSDNQPKKSKAKSSRSLENLAADSMVISSAEIAPAELFFVPGVNTGESGSTKRTMHKTSRGIQPKKSRAKFKSFRENLAADGIRISSAEKIASADVSLVPEVNYITNESGSIMTTRNESLREGQETNIQKSSSCINGLQLRFSNKSNAKDRMHIKETKITDCSVDVCAAENVPLATWLDSFAFEARSKRLKNKTLRGPRASNQRDTYCADTEPICYEKPRAEAKRSSKESIMKDDLVKGISTNLKNENDRSCNLVSKQGISNQLVEGEKVVQHLEHTVVDITVVSAPISDGPPSIGEVPVSSTTNEICCEVTASAADCDDRLLGSALQNKVKRKEECSGVEAAVQGSLSSHNNCILNMKMNKLLELGCGEALP